MTIFRGAARNVSIVAASHLVMWVATFGFTIAQARYLGAARFGELSLALAYTAFLAILIDFGLNTQLTRIVAQRSERLGDALAATMLVRAAIWVLAIPLLWLVTATLGYERELRDAILILAVSVFFTGVSSTITAFLQGREEFLLPSIASIAQRLTAAGVGTLVLMLTPDLQAVAGAFVLAAAVNVLVLGVGLRGRARFGRAVDVSLASRLFQSAIPLAVYWMATTFYFNVDMVMLERMAPAENVGWYAAAYRLFNAAGILPIVVSGMVLYPVLSRLSLGSREELRAVIEKALTFLTLSGVAVALLLVAFADQIIALLYPVQEYAGAVNALRLLAPGLVFLYLSSVLGNALFAAHQERRLVVMAIGAAVLNLLANFVAIPPLAQDGAAITTSLTELGLLVWLVRTMPRDLLSGESVRVALKAVAAAFAAALVAIGVRNLGLIVAVPLVLIAYTAVALALRAVGSKDLHAVLALVGRAQVPADVPMQNEAA